MLIKEYVLKPILVLFSMGITYMILKDNINNTMELSLILSPFIIYISYKVSVFIFLFRASLFRMDAHKRDDKLLEQLDRSITWLYSKYQNEEIDLEYDNYSYIDFRIAILLSFHKLEKRITDNKGNINSTRLENYAIKILNNGIKDIREGVLEGEFKKKS